MQEWEKQVGITADRFVDHDKYYQQLAAVMGIGWPSENPTFMGRTRAQWAELLEKDSHLNNVPLREFDRLYALHHRNAGRLKLDSWSPSQTVCCLKAVIKKEVG